MFFTRLKKLVGDIRLSFAEAFKDEEVRGVCTYVRTVNGKSYTITRKSNAGKFNPMYGRKRSAETVAKWRKTKYGDLPPNTVENLTQKDTGKTSSTKAKQGYWKGKFGKDHCKFGKKHSQEAKDKMKVSAKKSSYWKGKFGKEHCRFGKTVPQVTRDKMSASARARYRKAKNNV